MRGFLFGAMVGALAALMVAPRRGEETREMVRTRVGVWQDQMMTQLEQARSELQSTRREMLARFDDLRIQFEKSGQEARGAAEQAMEGEARPPEAPPSGA